METKSNNDFQDYLLYLQESITDLNYSGADIGDNPVVNLANGRLRYAFPDISIGHGYLAIDVSHIYSSKLNASFASNCKGVGYGWKLNVHQSLISDNSNSNRPSIVKYMDEKGEIHRFVQFDVDKYHDDRNAKNVLYYSSDTKYITDGVGNTLYFDSQGRLSKTVSCHNSAIEKRFSYDDDGRLISVCTFKGAAIKGKIILQYNSENLLSEMTSYSKTNKKLYGLKYHYITDGNKALLANVEQVTFDKNDSDCIPKPLYSFEYSNGYLSRVINVESKESFSITYGNWNEVTKVQTDSIVTTAIPSGLLDSKRQSLTTLGSTNCGMSSKSEYIFKAYKKFEYFDLSGNNTLSTETDVTNEKGIKMAYFVSRDACIVSSFEKDVNGNLFTLKTQGEQRAIESDTNTLQRINGNSSLTTNAASFVITFGGRSLARNVLEKKCRYYNYSFWLKIPKSYERLQVVTSIKFIDDTLELPNTVWIDGKAQNAWQRVSLPIALKIDNDGNPISNCIEKMTIQFYANGILCQDTFVFNEIGYAPSPTTDLLLALSSSTRFMALKFAKQVRINGEVFVANNQTDTNTYFTENDVIATFTNKYAHPYTYASQLCFDAICNNGSKRIPNVNRIQFGFGAAYWSDDSKTCPFRLLTVSTMPNSQVITNYKFSTEGITVENVATSATGKESTTSTLVDYNGKTHEETDEYGVKTIYGYDKYGNVETVKTVGSDGIIGSISSVSYDDDGRLSSGDNGIIGQNTEYNDYEQVSKVIETKFISPEKFEETSRSKETRYGVYRDKPVCSIEHSAETDSGNTNNIVYEDGQIRVVSDAWAKYGIKYDRKTNSVEYTQFDNRDEEQPIQIDSVTNNGSSGETHETRHFNIAGDVIDRIVTSVNKYGQINNLTRRNNQGTLTDMVTYSYPTVSESQFAAKPTVRKDLTNGIYTTYNYDLDGNLIGWEENDSDDNFLFSVQQVSDCVTKYKFNDSEEYFTEIVYDSDKVLAPRIVGTKIYFDNSKKYDNPKEISKKEYEYDDLGRPKKLGDCSYSYKPMGNSYVLENEKLSSIKYLYGAGGPPSREVNYDIQYSYDDRGNVKGIKQTYSWCAENSSGKEFDNSGSMTTYLAYDSLHRIVRERNDALGIDNYYGYSKGRLSRVIKLQSGARKTYGYDTLGRLSGVANTLYVNDAYGNRISKKDGPNVVKATYTYKFGNRLVGVSNGKSISYQYNADGVRCQKTVDNKTTKYFLDGNKILGENRGSDKLRYFYDANGLTYLRYNLNYYTYCCDAFGNVVFLLDEEGLVAARYAYDIWGNCYVYNVKNELDTNPYSIGNINPFRWKGFYFDAETGLYYANGSYYDPEVGYYLDASPVSTVFNNASNPRYLDRQGLMCDNVLALAANLHTIFTATELHADPQYDSYAVLPWWVKVGLWVKKAMSDLIDWFNNLAVVKWYRGLSDGGKLALGASLLALAALFAYAADGVAGVISVLVEVAIGVGVGISMESLHALNADQKLTKEGIASAALDSFVISALFACLQQFANAVKTIARSSPYPQAELVNECTGGSQCFIEGTLVLTEDGYKKIEDIQVGDKVLAYNEETGEQAYKEVVRLFRNKTTEWYHIKVNGEEITCTAEHPFYVPSLNKFIPAKDLTVGTQLWLSDGAIATIEEISVEQLVKSETTYNFEVADYHTYYVTESAVLAHNKCWEWGQGSYHSPEESLTKHFYLHGEEVGATSIEEYLQMAKNYADEVVNYGGKFMHKVSGFTKGVERFTMGDNLYIDIVKKTKTIISFGAIWY